MRTADKTLMALNGLNKCVSVVILKCGARWGLFRSRWWLHTVNKVSDVAGSCIKNQVRSLAPLP